MRNRSKWILCMGLAFTMAASVTLSGCGTGKKDSGKTEIELVQYKPEARRGRHCLTDVLYHKGCPGTGRGDPRLCAGCLRICGGIGSAAGEHQYGNYLMRIDSADDSDRIGSDSFRNAVYAG